MTTRQKVRVSTLVDVPSDVAFKIFTEETDLWWQRGFRFRASADPESRLHFEGGEGGRLIERAPDIEGGEFEFGRILVWKPAERLTFEYRAKATEPGEESEVDVRFTAEGKATRITLTQTGWAELRDDHPVRHGLVGEAFLDMLAVYWADLLHAARVRASERTS